MADVMAYVTARYMVEWMKRNGTNQQQIDAERRLRDLQRGTA